MPAHDARPDPLDGLTVPVPCPVPWESMSGDAARRYCSRCRLHVHDLSAMRRDDAAAFVREARTAAELSGATEACVRFRRRPDGRIVTRDCVTVAARIRRRARLTAAAVAAVLGLGGAAVALKRSADETGGLTDPATWEREPWATVARWVPASWLPARALPPVVGRLLLLPGETPAPPPDPGDGAGGG